MNRSITTIFFATLAALLLTGCGTCQLNKQSLDQVQAARESVAAWKGRLVDGKVTIYEVQLDVHDANLAGLEANLKRSISDKPTNNKE